MFCFAMSVSKWYCFCCIVQVCVCVLLLQQLLLPQVPFYTKLGQECVAAGCGVEVFLFPNTYIDVATVAEVSRLTGGSVHKYTYFQADLDGERFIEDLKNSVSKVVAFDAVMRVRTSTGA